MDGGKVKIFDRTYSLKKQQIIGLKDITINTQMNKLFFKGENIIRKSMNHIF